MHMKCVCEVMCGNSLSGGRWLIFECVWLVELGFKVTELVSDGVLSHYDLDLIHLTLIKCNVQKVAASCCFMDG